ncbi:MAG: discoidin domain-containing protein [Planctomycetes bacterium]|jgi:hypothetical protein|nr:discoidin domain-containing protein [Planctomycetota bacterium]
MFALLRVAAGAGELKPGNIAALAKASASSSRPEYPLPGANDDRTDTQWSTALGQTNGQWLRLDWSEPREIRGGILLATGPWTQSIDVPVDRDGFWISVARCGSAEEKVPIHVVISFPPVRAESPRFAFIGGAAYHEVEVYADAESFARATAEYSKVEMVVAGDLRGRLMGTVSQDSGDIAVRDADVTVVKGDLRAAKTFESRDISTCLTPRSEESRNTRIALDGTWESGADPPRDFPRDRAGMKWSPIRRPVGEAVAHPTVDQVVPPGDRPYGLDDHPWGSDDFRSTKRKIFTASMTDKARAGKDGYHYGPGRTIRPGEILRGTVRLRMSGGR